MIIGKYTTQYLRDYNNPIGESLETNQYNGFLNWGTPKWLVHNEQPLFKTPVG